MSLSQLIGIGPNLCRLRIFLSQALIEPIRLSEPEPEIENPEPTEIPTPEFQVSGKEVR